MTGRVGTRTIRLVALLLYSLTALDAFTWDDVTPLDTYVHSDDGYYTWEYVTQHEYDNATVYVINMTSQKWTDETYTSRAVWWHWMGVAIPHDIQHPDTGFIITGGGSNEEFGLPPGPADMLNVLAANIATDTKMCGGYVAQVPNQPIVFANDPSSLIRYEDRIIAWTWRTYLDAVSPDPTVIMRLPMTKATKRGMDTIYEVAKEQAPSTNVSRFVAAGVSKRGWTAWSIACSDQRVVAVIPLVFSLLNMDATLQNHFQNMDGAWSFVFEPYWDEGLTADVHTPRTQEIWDVEDMYRYFDRLVNIPKLAVSSSGDEFFIPDDNWQWWDDMPGPKHLLMLPNAEHTMVGHYDEIYNTVVSWIICLVEGIALPDVTWTMQETALGGLIVMDTNPPPKNITAWNATTLPDIADTRRDYRLLALSPIGNPEIHPVDWRRDISVIDYGNGRQYGAAAEKVDGEWLGFFISAIWEGPAPHYYDMTFTTQVNIIPDTHPREPCLTNAECYGYLT